MARITRKYLKIFGSGALNNGQFGSRAAGAGVNSTDPTVIQNLGAWLTGWLSATISAKNLPPLEEMQGVQYVQSYMAAYLLQEGIPEYDALTPYYANSIVKKPGTYQLYGSISAGANTGNALPAAVTDANWQYLGDLSSLSGGGFGAASNTQSNTGTATNVGLTPGNFGSQNSIGTSGYQKLPGGLILQWGQFTSAAATPSVTFPITFPNACTAVIPCAANGAYSASAEITQVSSFSSSGFVADCYLNTAGGANGLNTYFAIGY